MKRLISAEMNTAKFISISDNNGSVVGDSVINKLTLDISSHTFLIFKIDQG